MIAGTAHYVICMMLTEYHDDRAATVALARALARAAARRRAAAATRHDGEVDCRACRQAAAALSSGWQARARLPRPVTVNLNFKLNSGFNLS